MAAKPHVPAGLPTETRQQFDLTPEMIEGFKSQLAANGYPTKLYKLNICGTTVVFRPLLLGDYNLIQQFVRANENTVRQEEIDQKICESALVFPQEILFPQAWEVQPAGLQTTLAREIMARSGFIVPEVDQTGLFTLEPLTTVEAGVKPDAAVVAELKAKFNWALKLLEIDGQFYVIRPINRHEWRQLSQSAGDQDIDMLTAERACVWSASYPAEPKFGELVAGVARTISEVVMQISGFNQVATVEEL